jgi:hypothetical protein
MRIYYSRPAAKIGTREDGKNLRLLRELYPGAQIDAPTKKDCRKKKQGRNSMASFFKRVDKVDRVVVAESVKGHLSAGVFAEAQHAHHDQKPVDVLRGRTIQPVKKMEVVPSPDYRTKWAKLTLKK